MHIRLWSGKPEGKMETNLHTWTWRWKGENEMIGKHSFEDIKWVDVAQNWATLSLFYSNWVSLKAMQVVKNEQH
jgi:hypothetical protein